MISCIIRLVVARTPRCILTSHKEQPLRVRGFYWKTHDQHELRSHAPIQKASVSQAQSGFQRWLDPDPEESTFTAIVSAQPAKHIKAPTIQNQYFLHNTLAQHVARISFLGNSTPAASCHERSTSLHDWQSIRR